MATRSPVQIHNFWGAADSAGIPWTAGTLPNVAGPLATLTLQAGDFAYVAADSTFYLCTNPGTIGPFSAATWVPIQTGSDKFAPRWIVGNELAPSSDPNVPQAAPFRYIPDPGDGSGIAQALAEATAVGQGDILVRSGTYTLPTGLVLVGTAIFDIPSNVTLRGAGWETQIIGPADQRAVFKVNELGTLADIKIVMSLPTQSPTGALVVELAGNQFGYATARNVYVDASLSQYPPTLDSLIGGIGSLAEPQGSGSFAARALDCVVIGNVYWFVTAPEAPPREFSCYSFPDADQAIIRGQGTFGDYLLDLTGSSSRCTVGLQAGAALAEPGPLVGENFRTAKIGGQWHQIGITGITFFTGFEITDPAEAYSVKFVNAQRCTASLVLVGFDGLELTTALIVDQDSVGNRISLTTETFQVGAEVQGSKNILSGIAVNAGAGNVTTGVNFTATSSNNVLIGGVLEATTPIIDLGTLNEIAHTV